VIGVAEPPMVRSPASYGLRRIAQIKADKLLIKAATAMSIEGLRTSMAT
jgi:hypothetical protein